MTTDYGGPPPTPPTNTPLASGPGASLDGTPGPCRLVPGEHPDRVLIAASVAANGWPVLALWPGTKKPTHRGSETPNHGDHWLTSPAAVALSADEHDDREPPEGALRGCPSYAAMTGQPSSSLDGLALVALDLDGDPAALVALLAEAGPDAEEWASATLRVQRTDERAHLWGTLPADKCPPTGDLAPGLEWRGSTGYAALPGSRHKSGALYEVTGGRYEFTDGGQPDGALYVGMTDPDDADPLGLAVWVHPLPVPTSLLAVIRARLGAASAPHSGGGMSTDEMRELLAVRSTATTTDPATSRRPAPGSRERVSGPAYARVLSALRDAGLVARVKGDAKLIAHCPGPGHLNGDRHPGLSVRGVPGRVLLRCHAGCETADVLDALGLGWSDLYDDENGDDAVTLHAVDEAGDGDEAGASGATYADRPRQPVTLADLAPLLPGDDVAELLHLDRVPESLRPSYLRTVAERLMWRQADTAARDVLTASAVAASGLPTAADLMRPGGDFVLDSPALPVPVWGEGELVVMAEGESLMLLGRAGSGKTTLAQQWAMGRCGLPGFSTLLGLPVAPGERRTLYLAMDRPRQAVRSLRRMVTSEMRDQTNDRLRFWPGPPPVDLTRNPDALGELCAAADADSVVVDSLKDAGSVVDDEGGTGWNAARQRALVAGIAVVELHHPRKSDGDTPSLETAYGSTWLTAGAGSVLAITGKPGDALVRVDHLKQPAEPVGPLKVLHDHPRGRSTVWDSADLEGLARRPDGVTALEAARAIYETDKPDPNQRQAARRRLTSLVKAGDLRVLDPGDKALNRPTRWGAAGGAG